MVGIWKKLKPTNDREIRGSTNLGAWSRSYKLRLVVWVVVILGIVVLALVTSAYLSGFDSIFDMFSWYRSTFSS